MSNFYVGQKVVCVDDSPGRFRVVPLVRGEVYTVRSVIDNGLAIQILERAALFEHLGCGFLAHRFRPIDSLAEQIERIEQEGAPVEPELEPQYA